RQLVVVKPFEVDGAAGVIIAAQVCAEERIAAADALFYSSVAPLGALVVERGVYVLRQTLPLATLTGEVLVDTVRRAAAEAARLRQAVSPRRAEATPYAHFAL